MKYKDKLFCIFVFLHLFIFGSGILGAVLALSACFIFLRQYVTLPSLELNL